jgi:hypothetical protein
MLFHGYRLASFFKNNCSCGFADNGHGPSGHYGSPSFHGTAGAKRFNIQSIMTDYNIRDYPHLGSLRIIHFVEAS